MERLALKARAICNPGFSGRGHEPTDLRREPEGYDLEWITTQSPGRCLRGLPKSGRRPSHGLLMVVGGDGRISEVVNGLGKAGFSAGATLAILPVGTGNDLAAALAIHGDPAETVAVLRQNRVRTLDAIPRANSEDGLLDLVVIEDMGVLEVLKLAPTVLADSDYLDKEGVFFARAKEIRVEANPGSLEFTVDGEVIGDEPALFAVIPEVLKVVVVGSGTYPEP
jgi:diacylglycerol kinase family enzyme